MIAVKTHTYRDLVSSQLSTLGERVPGRILSPSVLCVHDNPVFLDRICRHLEQRGDISVEISISAEAALHLMMYVPFDVIVTDYTLEPQEKNGFLKTIRGKGNPVPVIYFTCTRDAGVEDEALLYGAVQFIGWEKSLSRGFEELYLAIKQAAHGKRKKNDSPCGVSF